MSDFFPNGSTTVWANSPQCGTCVYWAGCKRFQGRRVEFDPMESSFCKNPHSSDYGNKVRGNHHCDNHKMTFVGKIRSIDRVKMQSAFTSGYAKTIDDFWNDFPKPNVNVAKKWHDLLMQYIKKPNAVFSTRCGRQRGFYVDFTGGCRIVYADNIQAKIFFTMYMDGFVPHHSDELIYAYQAHQVPVGEGKRSDEDFPFPTKSNVKCFKGNYLAHIVAVAEEPYFDSEKNKSLSQKEIIEEYCNPQKNHSWVETKKYLIAMFLRYVHPFNYFVVPGTKYQFPSIPLDKNNIGEHKPMVAYVKKKYSDLYGNDYKQFLELVMAPTLSTMDIKGDELIDLRYSGLIR